MPDPPGFARLQSRAYHAARGGWPALFAAAGLAAGAAPPAAGLDGATRVVSLSPVGTELVAALGEARRLVAVDAASAALPGLGGVPVTELAGFGAFAPDLVLVPPGAVTAARSAAPAAGLIEVAPHDFDDAWALCTAIGAVLGRAEDARRFVLEASRPLAELGALSFGRRRPRVAAVLGLEPLEVAGGHSFITDLIELAGGESVGHGTEEPRLAWSAVDLARAEPELVVIVTPRAASPQQRARAAALFAPGLRVEFLTLDAEREWLSASLPAARRLRAWIQALDAPLATRP